jgi:hypothetical protein
MMDEFRIDPELAETAVASPRFEMLSKLNVDVSTIGTWDPGLSRRSRILVPIDVQAYVVPAGATELTVDLLGDPETDPAPFEVGAVRAAGVHLHWAMPDALLAAARPDPTTRKPDLPVLPDQWVVIRTLQPVGHSQVLATGWVIDARTKAVTPLPAFTGPATALPDGAVSPLTGFSLGAHWTSSYTASAGRFAFHDPLADLEQLRKVATAGFEGDQAVYTVAGWWSDATADPLSGARGIAGLDAKLAGLGWDIDHDLRDLFLEERDTREVRMEVDAGLDRPDEHAVTEIYGSDGRRVGGVEGTDLSSGTPFVTAFKIAHGDSLPRYDSLLHGSVLGVPVGALPAGDDKPNASDLTVALGADVDDVIAAMGAAGVGLGDDQRRAAEDLLAAFSHGLVAELGSSDGLDYLGHREHESGFWSLPGAPLPGMQPDLIQDQVSQGADPLTVGRHGRAGIARSVAKDLSVPRIAWTQKADLLDSTAFTATSTSTQQNVKVSDVVDDAATPSPLREVLKAPPRYFRPAPLMLAVRGAKPSHRHHGDGLFTTEGKLMCRYPRAAVPRYKGLLDGSRVVPTLGSGAVPAEVLTVVREAVLLNPYGRGWLAAATGATGENKAAITNRFDAEMVRMYGVEGTYDGSSHVAFVEAKAPSSWDQVSQHRRGVEQQISAVIAEAAITEGQPPSPVAITTWRQPWVPIWIEWRVTVTGTTTVRGWQLSGHDLEPGSGAEGEPVLTRVLTGRSLAGKGVGETLRAAVKAWLASETQRQATPGRTAYGAGTAVQRLADFDHPLDLLSASLDGLREQLLGIDFVGGVKRQDGKPVASGTPVPLFGGTVRVDDLRVVDAFGRYIDAPAGILDTLRTTLELEVEGQPRTLRLRPRIQNAARWLWRLVDPGHAPDTPPQLVKEAFVNQVAPASAVNPVSGFLLPDHIDEALEAFTVSGNPIGQVLHDPITNAVNWECAPGRPVPPDAGPLVDVAAQERIVAEIAAGMIRADAAARALATPPRDTALTAFLRAVDSTLWTVDTFASLGDSSLAGLVGRPIAVVRTILTLDAPDDVAELTLAAGQTPEARRAAFDALDAESFEVQLGTLGRADDTLLGFFVDDDYEKFFIVDKVVAQLARLRPTGRHLGHLGVLGSVAAEDPIDLDHPYLSDANRITMRRGQTTRLTLLMVPGGRVHLTTGVLPRKELALADAWFTPGMKKLMPSLRVGPLLVDPAEIRLPLVSILGENQTFTRRTGELAWKDDPILAATQTAYLPRLPHEIQEGWIRVTPTEESAE